MRVAIIYRPRDAVPAEALPTMMEGMGAWLQKHGARFETLEFFVAGGGFGVIDIADSAELHVLAAEHPFTPYSDVEVRPVVPPGQAMENLRQAFAARSGG